MCRECRLDDPIVPSLFIGDPAGAMWSDGSVWPGKSLLIAMRVRVELVVGCVGGSNL